MKDKVIMVL